MSQEIFANINPNTTSGTQLAQLLNTFKGAMVSGMSGPARPSQIQAGGIWVSTVQEVSNDILTVYLYDGVKDIRLFDVDKVLGVATVNNILDTLEISENSEGSDGPVISFKKSRNGGQTKLGDSLGEVEFKGVTNDTTDVIQGAITVEAIEDVTATAQGAVMKFMVTPPTGIGAVEVIRLYDGAMSVGTGSAPRERLHVSGNLLLETISNTDAPILKTLISPITGGVGVGQELFKVEVSSVDSTSTEFVASEIKAVSEGAHTDISRGTSLIFRAIKAGQTVLSDVFKYVGGKFITDEIEATSITTTTSVTTATVNATDVNATGTVTAESAIFTNLTATNTTLGVVTEIEDASITLNHEGDEATAIASKSGIEVEMSDADNAYLGYLSTSPTGFGIGKGLEFHPVVDTECTQTLQNKSFENVVKLEPKRDTLSNLTTFASTASAGQLVSDTEGNNLFITSGTGLKKLAEDKILPSVTVTTDIDWSQGFVFHKEVTTALTLTQSNIIDGKTISVIMYNTSASIVSITMPSGVLKSPDFPTSISAGKTLVVTLMSGGGNTVAVATGEME